jgi:mannose-6-phosphate isomerase-like protein (cupin superfamily)
MALAIAPLDAHRMTASSASAESPSQHLKVRIVEPGTAHAVPFLDGSVMSFLARGSDTDELVSFWQFDLPGGGQGPPPHIHHGHDELFYVVDGALTIHSADDDVVVGAGTLVVVPRGAQHTFSNPSSDPMRMVGTFSPARFEHYFDELSVEIAKHGGARPEPSVIAGLYAKYDSNLVT